MRPRLCSPLSAAALLGECPLIAGASGRPGFNLPLTHSRPQVGFTCELALPDAILRAHSDLAMSDSVLMQLECVGRKRAARRSSSHRASGTWNRHASPRQHRVLAWLPLCRRLRQADVGRGGRVPSRGAAAAPRKRTPLMLADRSPEEAPAPAVAVARALPAGATVKPKLIGVGRAERLLRRQRLALNVSTVVAVLTWAVDAIECGTAGCDQQRLPSPAATALRGGPAPSTRPSRMRGQPANKRGYYC